MHVTRLDGAPSYEAAGHAGMAMRRLQGREAGPADTLWIGHSTIAPGGGTTLSASDVEKFYVVLSGALRIDASSALGESTARLAPLDSARIAPGEARRLTNEGTEPCVVLLVMPLTRP